MGDETWLPHFEPETKGQSLEWHHAYSPKKKFKTASLSENVMATMFFDLEGLLLVDVMPHFITINTDTYVATLMKFQARLYHIRPCQQKQDVLLLHNNSQPHASH